MFTYDEEIKSPVYVTTFAFNLKDTSLDEYNLISVITESVSVVYVSETNIYVTFRQRIDNIYHTILHKIFYWKTNIIPFADGVVQGSVANSFQLDEHLDILRIATTS